jgi:hypothetical protein
MDEFCYRNLVITINIKNYSEIEKEITMKGFPILSEGTVVGIPMRYII